MNQKYINLIITIASISLIAGVALAIKMENVEYIKFVTPQTSPPLTCDAANEGVTYYNSQDDTTYVCNGTGSWMSSTVEGNISPATVTTTDGQIWLNDTGQEGNIYNTNYIYGYNDLRLHSSPSPINYSSIYLGDGAGKMITFYIDGDEKMKIDSTGDVTINQNLTVTGDTAIGGTLTLTTGFQSCDAVYTDASGILTCGGTATNNQVWKKDGSGVLGWSDEPTGGATITGTPAAGRVAFFDSASSITSDSDFFWDSTNNRLNSTGTINILGPNSQGVLLEPGLNDPNFSDIAFYNGAFKDGRIDAATLALQSRVAGNVGIGTASPGYPLEVSRTGATRAQVGIYSAGNVPNDLFFGNNTQKDRYSITSRSSSEGYDLRIYRNNAGWDAMMAFDWATGNVGIGTNTPQERLHLDKGRLDITASDGTSGGGNRFDGIYAWNAQVYRRAQLVLSSGYSDLVIASSQANNNHGSTLTFATYNPSNAADYRKFVINQGNWGSRRGFLDFGYSETAGRINPHSNINNTDTVLTLDGVNKRVGIGITSPSGRLHVNNADDSYMYYTSTGNLYLYGPESVNGAIDQVRIGAAWNRPGVYSSRELQLFSDTTGIIFGDSNTELMRLTAAGNLGIGTTGPSAKLEVAGWYGRTAHNNGGFVGSYNNVGANSQKSNPIYVIGSSYQPLDSTLGNMYGIGYTHTNASFVSGGGSGWGMYVAADGDARIFLNGSTGGAYFAGNVGIGTANPRTALDVGSGDIITDGAYYGPHTSGITPGLILKMEERLQYCNWVVFFCDFPATAYPSCPSGYISGDTYGPLYPPGGSCSGRGSSTCGSTLYKKTYRSCLKIYAGP